MRLVSALLARNEAGPDRYFAQVLRRCASFSDTIIVLDDGSTDGTAEMAKDHGAIVERRSLSVPAWGNESHARRELWDLAVSHCPDEESWLLICDADQELVGDVRSLGLSLEVNTWCFALHDMWDAQHYREDQFWTAHKNPRPWMFAPKRVPDGWVAEWSQRGVHTGHCPLNFPMVAGIAPPDVYWLHWAYATPEARQRKHEQYAKTFHLMSPAERAHAESILT